MDRNIFEKAFVIIGYNYSTTFDLTLKYRFDNKLDIIPIIGELNC